MSNPTGRHKAKRRHHGEGTVLKRTDHWRAKPWSAVIPYVDAAGRRREMWLSAASRAEADDLRKAELAKLRKGIVRTEQTVGEYVTAWLADVEVGPGTWPRYQSHVTERIAPTLGAIALRLLTPQHVRSAVIRWDGAPATRAGALRLLRAAMKQAVTDRRIEHDPTAGIPYPKTARREAVTLTAAEAKHLMATVKGERFAPILIASLGLGVRRGEALGLRTRDINWEDYDGEVRRDGHSDGETGIGSRVGSALHSPSGSRGMAYEANGGRDEAALRSERGGLAPDRTGARHSTSVAARPVSVTIAKGLRYIAPSLRAEGEGPYRLTGTKTGETRVVPLPAFVAESLRDRLVELETERRAAKVYAPNDFVFCDRVGNSVPLETLRTWFLGALKRAGLQPVRWHDLRGTCVTLLYEMDVPEAVIMAIIGHKDLETTMLYKGKTPKAMSGAAARMDEAIG